MDALEDAVAVFDATGDLLISNRRYVELWDSGARNTLDDPHRGWLAASGPKSGMTALRRGAERSLPTRPSARRHGRPLGRRLMSWGCDPLSGGRFMVSFAGQCPRRWRPRTPQSGDAAAAPADEPARQHGGADSQGLPRRGSRFLRGTGGHIGKGGTWN